VQIANGRIVPDAFAQKSGQPEIAAEPSEKETVNQVVPRETPATGITCLRRAGEAAKVSAAGCCLWLAIDAGQYLLWRTARLAEMLQAKAVVSLG
jgi:hypothetical protein